MFDLTLSFDNGPEPQVTPFVLEILRKRGIKATFFVIGEKLADPERRRLAARAHDEGHWIGNHTYTHSLPLGLQHDPDTAEHEIARTQRLIGGLAHPQRWFRPFGGGGSAAHAPAGSAGVPLRRVLVVPRWPQRTHGVDRVLLALPSKKKILRTIAAVDPSLRCCTAAALIVAPHSAAAPH